MIPDKFTALFEKLQSKLEMDPPDVAGAQRIKNEDVKWSKGPSFSILPYGLELAGVTPSPILENEPKSKKTALNFIVTRRGSSIGQIYMV